MILACYSNKETRALGSSGGVFYEVAKKILEEGGAVYAAVYTEDFLVKHIKCNNIEDIKKACGSKYVQSDMGDIINDIKNDVKDKIVLYAGTPCQVAGVKNSIKSENLITIDFACHGVPSEDVWKKGLSELTKGRKLKSLNMRNKDTGWSNYGFCWKLEFEGESDNEDTNVDAVIERIKQDEVPYMNGFVKDIYLRPSCYACKFKGLERGSDITLGDFWEIWNVIPHMDDNKGTSIVLLNTQKGKEIFEKLKDSFTFEEVSSDNTALIQNAGLMKLPIEDYRRKQFYKMLDKGKSIESTVELLTGEKLTSRIKRKAIKMLSKDNFQEIQAEKNINKDNDTAGNDKININAKKSECCGCNACYSNCPVNAIKMKKDEEGFYYPEINYEVCIKCRKCESVCPIMNK